VRTHCGVRASEIRFYRRTASGAFALNSDRLRVVGLVPRVESGGRFIFFWSAPPRVPVPQLLRDNYWAAWVLVAGAQKRSKAAVSSSAMLPGSRLSMSRLSSMKTTLPSRISATEGDDGA
jgi:hypothetical protein